MITAKRPRTSAGVLSWNSDTPSPHASDDVRKVATAERGFPPNRSASSDLLVSSERLLAFGVVVDDRCRVVLRRFVEGPRLVDLVGRQGFQLGHPPADVCAVGVERLGLLGRVEDPEVGRRVGTRARGPLPAVLVVGQVTVYEVVH